MWGSSGGLGCPKDKCMGARQKFSNYKNHWFIEEFVTYAHSLSQSRLQCPQLTCTPRRRRTEFSTQNHLGDNSKGCQTQERASQGVAASQGQQWL